MRRALWKVGIVIGCTTVLLVIGGFVGHRPKGERSDSRGTLELVQPAFAQEVGGNFLDNEAGISCYVNVGQAIDLGKAKPLFKVLEDETDTYLIGTVELSGYDEYWWPHVWIHKDGWIVVYYPKDEPTSKLMHWHGFQRDQGTITTTTLREVLFSIARQLAVNIAKVESGLHYYHWQYPDAQKLLIVLDTGGADDFRYTIPSAVTVYEASASHYGAGVYIWGERTWSQTKIDGEQFLGGGEGTYILCRKLAEKHLTPDVPHTVSISHHGGWVGIALFFLCR